MKVAIVGSRGSTVQDLGSFLPADTTEIISGGAKGVDASAKQYAKTNGIPCTEVLPQYKRYGKGAPLKRNDIIIEMADLVLAFWDGDSRGTKYVIDRCRATGKDLRVILLDIKEKRC